MNPWTDERIETAKRLWTDNRYSAGRIAAELGCGLTRSAVLGKLHRLALAGRGQPASAVERRPRQVGARVRPVAEPAPHPASAPLPPDPPASGEPLMLGLFDLTSQTCRFPIGDPQHEAFGFCGGPPKPGSPYCDHHDSLCHIKAKPNADDSLARSVARDGKPPNLALVA